MLGIISIVETAATTIFPLAFTALWSATVDSYYPTAFLLAGGIMGLASIGACALRSPPIYSSGGDDGEAEEPQPQLEAAGAQPQPLLSD